LQLRVIRAFKSTLEDLEERRSVHSLHSLHSLRNSRSMQGQRPLSDGSFADDEQPLKTPSSPMLNNKLAPTHAHHNSHQLLTCTTSMNNSLSKNMSPVEDAATAASNGAHAHAGLPDFSHLIASSAPRVLITAPPNNGPPPQQQRHTAPPTTSTSSAATSSSPSSRVKQQVPPPPPRKALYQSLNTATSPQMRKSGAPPSQPPPPPPLELSDLPKLVHETSI
jgi:hypothetical protein